MSDPRSWSGLDTDARGGRPAADGTGWGDATTRLVDAAAAEARAWESVSRALDRLSSLISPAELAAAVVRECLGLTQLERAVAVSEGASGARTRTTVGDFTGSEVEAVETAMRSLGATDATRVEWLEPGPGRVGAIPSPLDAGVAVYFRVVARPAADLAVVALARDPRPRPVSGALRALEFFTTACARTFGAMASRSAAERERAVAIGENQQLRQLLGVRAGTDAIVGVSHAAVSLRRSVGRLAGSAARVLVTGEPGTGKTLVVSVLHATGATSDGRLIRVRCDAGDASLLDSLLFSPDGGRLQGRLAGATLHLDAVHALPPSTQDRLVDALARAGECACRILAETDRDLDEGVRAGGFRRDLASMLRATSIRVPGLDERLEDVPLLADAFAHDASARQGRPRASVTRDARRVLTSRTWPGHVRELMDAVERAVVLWDDTELPADAFRDASGHTPGTLTLPEGPFRDQMDELERLVVARTLTDHEWNISMSARSLDISRQHLHNLVRKHGLRRPAGARRRNATAITDSTATERPSAPPRRSPHEGGDAIHRLH